MTHPLLNFFDLWCSAQYQKAINDLAFGPIYNLEPNEEIIEIWYKNKLGSSIQLRSSGSSSSSNLYYFGPIDGILEIERFIKNFPLAMVQMHYGPNDFFTIKNKKYEVLFAFNPDQPDFSKLWKWGEKSKGGLCAEPNVWLFLSKNQSFLNELKSSDIKRISTTGWEPFFDQSVYPVHVNDNMLNLKTGDGFYTCEFHNVHCLPFKLKLQSGVANLLNLADKFIHNDDDEISWEYKECPCGVRLPICIERICHNKNTFRPKLEIVKLLEGQYKNWQAIKTKECINLFLSGNYPGSDVKIVEGFLGDCRICNGVRYKTGINKWASFWSCEEIEDGKIEVF